MENKYIRDAVLATGMLGASVILGVASYQEPGCIATKNEMIGEGVMATLYQCGGKQTIGLGEPGSYSVAFDYGADGTIDSVITDEPSRLHDLNLEKLLKDALSP